MKHFALMLFWAGFLLFMISCQNQITDTCDSEPLSFNGTFTEVQNNVFKPYCVGCHSGAQPQGGLDLSAHIAYSNLVNKSAGNSSLPLVKPGQPDSSYLMKRLRAVDGETSMPPSGKLEQRLIDLAAMWIINGAINN